jgi:hypothetical protein
LGEDLGKGFEKWITKKNCKKIIHFVLLDFFEKNFGRIFRKSVLKRGG